MIASSDRMDQAETAGTKITFKTDNVLTNYCNLRITMVLNLLCFGVLIQILHGNYDPEFQLCKYNSIKTIYFSHVPTNNIKPLLHDIFYFSEKSGMLHSVLILGKIDKKNSKCYLIGLF